MKLLSDLSIRTKFLLLPALAALLMAALGTVYMVGQRNQTALQQRINNQDVPNMRELARLFSEFSANHSRFISLLAASLRNKVMEDEFYAAGREKVKAVARADADLLALLARLPESAEESRALARNLHDRLLEYRDQMGAMVWMSSVDLDQMARFTLDTNEAYDAANIQFLALIDKVQEDVRLENRQLQESLAAAQTAFFLALAATIAIIAVGSLFLSRVFAADLTALMGMLKRLSEGDTSVPPPLAGRRDEFGAVYEVVRVFRQALQRRDEAEQDLKREIAERSQIGERLRQAVRASETGIFEYDLDADSLFVSEETRSIFGLEREQPVDIATYFKAIHRLDRRQVRAAVQRANDPLGDGSFHVEHRIIRQDGELRWLLVRAQTFFEGEGPARHPAHSVGALRDITDRKRIENDLLELNEQLELRVARRTEQLLAAKDEAERANLAKSEFLSRMSHELRTPMNAILGFGQLLELKGSDPAGIDPASQGKYVKEILRAGHHLLALIDEVLDLARVESGTLSVSPEPVAVLPVIGDCLALLRSQAQTQGIQLLEASRHCDVFVRVDRTRLKQVLLNLLSNAVKYNRPQGSVNVVCVVEPDHSPPSLCVRIIDTGAGLTPDQQSRLFVPFERLDADERRIQGTGIGLALSKRLVELMEGSIGVESVPGKGSTFWVRLPLAKPPAEPGAPPAPAQVSAAELKADVRSDVLCIEDNPANLRLIEGIFVRRPDIRLLTAVTPGMGLELARTHRPALILLDINLPDMDGYAVMQCLRESPLTRDIPVIAISANAMPKDLARGRAAGFVAYVTKPVAIDQLLKAVDLALQAEDG